MSPAANIVRLRVERTVAGGDGLAREANGRVVFVPGALPDEEVDVTIRSSKRDFARAELVEVVEPSPFRVDPPCEALARGCGGCDWQHVDPDHQLTLKAEIVREALRRTARMPDARVDIGGRVAAWSYRTTMRFALDAGGRPSLRRSKSNDLVPIGRCEVAHPALDALLPTLQIRGAEEVSLRVSEATGDRTAWWIPESCMAVGLDPNVGVGPESVIFERVAGFDLRVSAASFFQSGPAAAQLLVDAVTELAGDEVRVAATAIDAYGGVGLFALGVMDESTRVTLVEGSASACADARHNLGDRHVTVVETAIERWTPTPADVVVADPPRAGLGTAAIQRLVDTEAPTFLLISCDPVSLARDAALLSAAYRLDSTTVLDLFPNTHHVETVSVFRRLG